MTTEQDSNHRENSLTSGIENSNGYFPDVGGATVGLYQDNTSTATRKQLLPSAPLLSNLGGDDSYDHNIAHCMHITIESHNRGEQAEIDAKVTRVAANLL